MSSTAPQATATPMRALVARAVNQMAVETVLLDAPRPYEVLVRMRAAGVCHSDLHTLQGQLRATPPLVLGHEGAGVVVAAGANVHHVKAGDPVLVNWVPACNECPTCRRGLPNLCERLPLTTFQALLPDGTTRLHTQDGIALKHFLSTATFAEFAVLDGASVLPIPPSVPFEVAAVIGCAVITGVGAVLNTAQARAGQSAAVIGCGGVGLSALLGCLLAGCHPVVAVDTTLAKLDFARSLGATHTLLAGPGVDVAAELKRIVPGGPDMVLDSVGASATIGQALDAARPGGSAVIMGLHGVRTPATINPGSLVYQNKRLLGSFFGQSRPQVDLPMLVELFRAGRLPVDRLITQRFTLDEAPAALAALDRGEVEGRAVILFA
jgi:Zn-dependent alcohol dehydrogenase